MKKQIDIARQVIIPTTSTFDKTTDKKRRKTALKKIFFRVAQAQDKKFKDKLLFQLQKQSKEQGLTYSIKAKWHVIVEPFSFRSKSNDKPEKIKWIKVIAKIPFDNEKIKFMVRYNKKRIRKTVKKIFKNFKARDKTTITAKTFSNQVI